MATVAEKKPKKAPKSLVDPELQKAIDQIHKDEGDESLRIGLSGGIMKCEVISTRCLALDLALGVGGLPRGRVAEIYGPEASGKTTLALTVLAEAQSKGGVGAFIDAEHAVDPAYAAKIGVDNDKLLFSQPDSGEQALRLVEKLVDSGKVDIIVVDSVAALVPQAEIDGDIGDAHIGLQARLMGQALRKLTSKLSKTKTCLIFINQLRDKIGNMMPGSDPTTTPGGRALKFYASIRLDIRRTGSFKDSSDIAIGNMVKVKVAKNKVAPPFLLANFDIIFGKGCNTAGSLIDVGVSQNIIKKSGNMFAYGDHKLGNGRNAACDYLNTHPELLQELDAGLREIVFSKNTGEAPIATTDDAAAVEDPPEE